MGGFCHWDFTSSAPPFASGQWHGQKGEAKELPGILSPAKSFSHLPPAQVFSSDLEAGVMLEAMAKAGSSQHPGFTVTGEN